MVKSKRISDAVFQAVFVPTSVAYVCLVARYLRTGLILFTAFVSLSYMVGFFKGFTRWPLISKLTLACSAPLIVIGYFFSTQNFFVRVALSPSSPTLL